MTPYTTSTQPQTMRYTTSNERTPIMTARTELLIATLIATIIATVLMVSAANSEPVRPMVTIGMPVTTSPTTLANCTNDSECAQLCALKVMEEGGDLAQCEH